MYAHLQPEHSFDATRYIPVSVLHTCHARPRAVLTSVKASSSEDTRDPVLNLTLRAAPAGPACDDLSEAIVRGRGEVPPAPLVPGDGRKRMS